ALDGHYDKIPTPLGYCDDEAVIGAPFYVMSRVRGVILRGSSPDVEGLDASTMEELSVTLVREVAAIHDLDWEAIGLESFGKPEGYVERQVEGWIDRYHKSQTDEIGGMARAADWLRDHMPEEKDASLIHNDFKYDNLVLDPDDLTEVVAVLDWEMATVGDPLMDLGTEGNYTRREVVDRYEAITGRDCSDILFYYVYGLYKVAVIGQQIYYRYEQGHTDDPRFGMLIHAVKALADVAERAIEEETL
ncbi:MAG: phosphotransferase family protein, partial [Bradymonadaceae bacterium]